MAASDFFRDVGTGIFKPVGDFVSGAVTALQPGRVQQMREFAESQRIQNLLRDAQADALRNRPATEIQKLTAEGYTSEEAKMIRDISHGLEPRASSRLTYDNMSNVEKLKYLTDFKQKAEGQYYQPLQAEADMEGKGRKVQPATPNVLPWIMSELEKLPQYRKQGAGPSLETTKRPGFLGRKESEFPPITPKDTKFDTRDYFSSGATPTPKAPTAAERVAPAFEDLTQAAAPARTFEQLGITQTQDQQTLQEMQKALPNVDMKAEYENDPEGFKRLMKLWRDKKLSKKNLHKAFSMIQQRARQSLGIA